MECGRAPIVHRPREISEAHPGAAVRIVTASCPTTLADCRRQFRLADVRRRL
jgi:hypothetical protein